MSNPECFELLLTFRRRCDAIAAVCPELLPAWFDRVSVLVPHISTSNLIGDLQILDIELNVQPSDAFLDRCCMELERKKDAMLPANFVSLYANLVSFGYEPPAWLPLEIAMRIDDLDLPELIRLVGSTTVHHLVLRQIPLTSVLLAEMDRPLSYLDFDQLYANAKRALFRYDRFVRRLPDSLREKLEVDQPVWSAALREKAISRRNSFMEMMEVELRQKMIEGVTVDRLVYLEELGVLADFVTYLPGKMPRAVVIYPPNYFYRNPQGIRTSEVRTMQRLSECILREAGWHVQVVKKQSNSPDNKTDN